VWPVGTIDNIPTEGLAMGDYKLFPLWVWIYCLIWWLLQDLAKVGTYKFIYAVGLFGATKGHTINEDEIAAASQFDAAAAVEMDRLAREGKKKKDPLAVSANAPVADSSAPSSPTAPSEAGHGKAEVAHGHNAV